MYEGNLLIRLGFTIYIPYTFVYVFQYIRVLDLCFNQGHDNENNHRFHFFHHIRVCQLLTLPSLYEIA